MTHRSVLASVFYFTAILHLGCGDDAAPQGGAPDASSTTADAATSADAKVNADAAPFACPVGASTSLTMTDTTQGAIALLLPAQTLDAGPAAPASYIVEGPTGAPGGTAELFRLRIESPPQTNTAIALLDGCKPGGKVCADALGDFSGQGPQATGTYFMATGGTLTISKAEAANGKFEATLTNAVFEHATKSANQPPVLANDGCKTTANGTFKLTVKAMP